MTAHVLVAEFRDPAALVEAARRARVAGLHGLDAHTPFAVEGLAEALGLPRPKIRLAMLIGGITGAGLVYFMCWYSAVLSYPLVLGGRPLHTWQIFLVLTFEACVLSATLTGVVAFFFLSRLPELYHPIFDGRDFDRASQDRFFLAVADEAADPAAVTALLDGLGAVQIRPIPGSTAS